MKFLSITGRVSALSALIIMLVLPLGQVVSAATTNYAFSTTPDLLITEVQTATMHSSGEEFIELFNNTTTDIDLADTAHAGKDAWKIQYFSKTKLPTLLANSGSASGWTSPFRTISLTGVIAAGDYYVLAAEGYTPGNIEPDQTFSSTLADDGGALQLIDVGTAGTVTNYGIHDRLAWSLDVTLPSNTLLQTSPGAGASLQRLPNEDDAYVGTDGTMTGFTTGAVISPKNVWQPPAPVEQPPVPTDSSADPASEPPIDSGTLPPLVTNEGLSNPVITELLPNPASPQTDAENEYIELYNPNESAFNLKGYTLETGTTTLHQFTFIEDALLQPGEYRAFYSSVTNLSLSNSGGQVRLLDTSGSVISQSDVYAAAADGMSWSLDETDAMWKWSTATTPNAANAITAPIVAAKTIKANKIKTAVVKKASGKVKGITTTKKAKAKAKTKKAKVHAVTAATTTPVPTVAPIHPYVLAVVAVLAVGYGVYEYRNDIANRFYQLRSDRAARRAARK
jgi:hypothetical protein